MRVGEPGSTYLLSFLILAYYISVWLSYYDSVDKAFFSFIVLPKGKNILVFDILFAQNCSFSTGI